MELVCVIVLALSSLVTATPYGYGVKGGAAAKAEANAAAGTFSGLVPPPLPLSIPSGSNGYSGSFSKASSSSFASSSASSSSGSFSFSGTGGAVPGLAVNGVTGNTKCSSGSCQTGGYGPTGSEINGGYTGANAAATAGAGAIIFPGSYGGHNTPCRNNDCSSTKPACAGSNCDSDSGNKKCISGECGQTSGSLPSGYGTNDIYVSTSGSKSTDKSMTGSGTSCAYGICGQTAASNTKPFDVGADATPSATVSVNKPSTSLIAPKEEEPCTSPTCGSSNSGFYDKEKPSSYNVPANTVYSQNIAPCTSGNCGTNQPHTPRLPLPSGASTPSACINGNCVSSQPTPISSQNDYPDFVPLGPNGSPENSLGGHIIPSSKQPVNSFSSSTNTLAVNTGAVVEGNSVSNNYGATKPNILPVQKVPYTGGFGGPPGILEPNNFNTPTKLPASKPVTPTGLDYSKPCTSGDCQSSSDTYTSTGSLNPSSCTTGKCGSYPGTSNKPAAPTGPYSPACTSGNCEIKPISQLDQSGLPSKPYKPITSPQFGQSSSSIPTGPSGSYNPSPPSGSYNSGDCSSGNCGTQPISPQQNYNKPSGSYSPSSSHKPTTCLTGNCGSQPSQLTPQYDHSGFQTTTRPVVSYNPSGPSESHPTTCISGNCLSQPNTPTSSYKPMGSYYPSGPSESCTTGNCGSRPTQTTPQYGQNGSYKSPGPSGLYNSPGLTGSITPSVPTQSHRPTICSSGKCGTQSGQLPSQFGPSESHNKLTPSTSPHNNQSPNFESNGSYKPNPGGSYNPTKLPSKSPIPTSCSSGNCGSEQSQSAPSYGQNGAHKPIRPANSYNPNSPIACTSENCGPQPSSPQLAQSGSYAPVSSYNPSSSESIGATGCSLGNCGSQVGSSADGQIASSSYKPTGPSGTYNPSTCSTKNCAPQPSQIQPVSTTSYKPTGLYNPAACSTGNCGPHPGQLPSQSQTSGTLYKPSIPTGSYKPTVCSSGNCGTQPGHEAQSVSSSGTYNPATTVTGFGGPPGILKPNEFSVPAIPTYPSGHAGTGSAGPSRSYNPACSSGNCGAHGHTSTPQHGQSGTIGSNAGASAAAAANAISYTGGFGGPPGLLQPYDGKLPGNKGLQSGSNLGTVPGVGIHSSYGKSLNGATGGNEAGAVTHGIAIAGAASGSYGGSSLPSGEDSHVTGGCKGGCGSGGAGLGYYGSAAKSAASAVSNANAGAYSSSYASSSASAHASSGAATKGSYGKR